MKTSNQNRAKDAIDAIHLLAEQNKKQLSESQKQFLNQIDLAKKNLDKYYQVTEQMLKRRATL